MFKLIAISIILIISGMVVAPYIYKQYAIWDAGDPADDESFVNELLSPLTPKTSAADVRQAIDSGSAIPIVDVRSEEEYDKAHLPGAVLIPQRDLYKKIQDEYPDKSRTVYVYGTEQSGVVSARLLKTMGYEKAYNIEGGIDYWQKLQYPVETNNPLYF